METNQFDEETNQAADSSKIDQTLNHPFDFSGAPTTNGRYNRSSDKLIVPSVIEDSQKSSIVSEHVQAESKTEESEFVPYLTLVIPAYNEAVRLPDTLDTVLKWLENQTFTSEVVVVDDGSADDTTRIVKNLIQTRLKQHELKRSSQNGTVETCRLRLIENPHRGKGYAVRSGMLQSRGNFILFSDADLCTPISETNKLLFWLDQGFDVVIGSREGIGARRHGEPAYRHLMGRVFNIIVRIVTSSPFQDTQCGFKAFTRHSAHDLFRRVQLYADDSPTVQGAMVTGFDVEVLFLALKRNYRVKEVPVEWYHVKGSKVSPVKDSLRMLRDIASVRLNDWRGVYKR